MLKRGVDLEILEQESEVHGLPNNGFSYKDFSMLQSGCRDPLVKEESQSDIPINHSISTLKKGICKKVEHGEITNMWDLGDSFWVVTIQVFYHKGLKVRSTLGLKHDQGGIVKRKQDYKTSIPLHSLS